MSKQPDIKHIEQIFGSAIIIPLALLLPTAKELPDAPTLPSARANDCKYYVRTINHFVQLHTEHALSIITKECVDLSSKLVLFLCYRGDKSLQEGVAESLSKLAEKSDYSAKMVRDGL